MSVQRIFDIKNIQTIEEMSRQLPTFFEGFSTDEAEYFKRSLEELVSEIEHKLNRNAENEERLEDLLSDRRQEIKDLKEEIETLKKVLHSLVPTYHEDPAA